MDMERKLIFQRKEVPFGLGYLKEQGPPSREQQLERTECGQGGGAGLRTAVKAAVCAGESSGFETRGQEERQLQQNLEEREERKRV